MFFKKNHPGFNFVPINSKSKEFEKETGYVVCTRCTAFIIAQWRKKFRFLVRLDNDYHHGAVISLDELAMQQRTTGEHSSSAPA